MKRERTLTCLTGFLLAFLLSFGAVGAMVTGLGLDVSGMGRMAFVCLTAAAVSAVCFRFRWGGTVLLCLLAVISFFLWRRSDAAEQTLGMLYRVSGYYDAAYGWGTLPWSAHYRASEVLDYPVGILGALAAMAVSRCVCRQKRPELAIFASAVPVAACFVVTDTVPEAKYLYLWMLGLGLLVLTGGTRRRSLSQGLQLTAMAAVPAALALALLFWAVPREGYDKHPEELLDRIVTWVMELPDLLEDVSDEVVSNFDGTVQPEKLNLSTLGPRVDRVYPVMEVTAEQSGRVYLRGMDYDTYSGTGWTSAQRRLEDFPEQPLWNDAGDVTIKTRRVRDVLYLPYYPGEVIRLVGGAVDNSEDVKEYTFSRSLLPDNWRDQVQWSVTLSGRDAKPLVEQLSPVPPTSQLRFQTLPNETRTEAVELLKEILTDEQTVTAAADTIAEYVRDSARYDTDTERMPVGEADFALWFLEDSETGYCVHFATATVVLLRAAGIEARYVEGYMFDARAGESVTVTADQAHAWAEYYEPVLDVWIVLESTPADLSTVVETDPAETETVEATTLPEETERENPEASEQPTDTTSASHTGGSDRPEEKLDLSWLGDWLKAIFAALLAVAAVLWQRKLRLEYRRRRQKKGPSSERALARWQEILLLSRLLKEAPPAEAEDIAQKAKYSRHGISPEEMKTLDGCIRTSRQRLQEKPWYLDICYRYIFAAY